MNVIILAGTSGLMDIVDATGASVPACELLSGRWRIVRRDNWQYDERTVSALRSLAARPDIELIDPTGLLGGSQYGAERNAVGSNVTPFGRGAAGAKVRTTKRKRAGSDLSSPL